MLASYIVDVHNLFGAKDFYRDNLSSTSPGVWSAWFGTKGPTEYFQWFFLGMGTLGSFSVFWFSRIHKGALTYFWLLVSITFALLFFEDYLDLRDQLTFFSSKQVYFDFAVIFVLVSFIALRYGRRAYSYLDLSTFKLFFVGAIVYGLVAVYHVAGLHFEVGNFINTYLASGHLTQGSSSEIAAISDSIIEEGAEFLAAGLLVVGVATAPPIMVFRDA
ncbi:hypothetical protein LCGC14_1688990 [marine sediment metagenome]|uniref:Uncharacterized protein n=1 Tax=marine sediment metagenome TaxID=412755 RepID=A0A0F9KLH0_9ZZZZ